MCVFFFLKQKTAYEMRISDWSSDVCSSDLVIERHPLPDGGHVSMAAILNIPDSSRGHAVAENLAIAFTGAGCRTLSPHLAQFADDVLRRYRKAIGTCRVRRPDLLRVGIEVIAFFV